MTSFFAFVLVLQQHAVMSTGNTTPPSGDTVGYWQQRVTYTITATLDEPRQCVHARARMTYVNNSPDTLREMYVHQYLNAFRPHSVWSAIDEREGRERFQRLREPDYGYERFTAPPRVKDVAVRVDYPGAPDSTVAHFVLPSPLVPGDSTVVDFEWDARPSTVPRRQGRRQRHWDLAQWYPKVAVYDRAGWEFNALQPAGEFYGEFGTYDVTLIVPRDQILGATGVPVSGDPGWSQASRSGSARLASRAYDGLPTPPTVTIPDGYQAVRFFARDVHHFAWSASPNYRYEGGTYVRDVPGSADPAWDTVSVHVLYLPGDDSTWGGQRAVSRTIAALRWLEAIYGPYAYPQMTVLHRLDGGGTEFPMMQMNGSASQGLILHEGGHVFTYGILGNNEWRSGWMDEGLTSYQTDWAQGFTPQGFAAAGGIVRPPAATGYRALGIRMALSRADATALDQALTDIEGRAEPIGTRAQDFRDFNTYNDMIYDRAAVMYGQLRDVIGDSAFVAFLHDYYARWKLKHVDERAMRASAERASGMDLGWFFDQWVHHTGVTNYAITHVDEHRDGGGNYSTAIRLRRHGGYRHRMTVGVRTASGWTLAKALDPAAKTQTILVLTREPPLEVRLDPLHTSWDWNRLDDTPHGWIDWLTLGHPRWNVDWPFLAQADRDRALMLVRPMAWYSDAGGANLGVRARTSYLGSLFDTQAGLVVATRSGVGDPPNDVWDMVQPWIRSTTPWLGRGEITAGFAVLDDIVKTDAGWSRTIATQRGARSVGFQIVTTRLRNGAAPLVPELWTSDRTADVGAQVTWKIGPPTRGYWFFTGSALGGGNDLDTYLKGEFAAGRVRALGSRSQLRVRAYYGAEANAPAQRALYLSAQDPVTSFENSWWRPSGAILKRPNVDWLPLGGAALRGYHWDLAADNALAANAELATQVGTKTWARGRDALLAFRLHAFADVATPSDAGAARTLGDAGVGVSITGRLYDRPVFVRIDSPFYVSEPQLAIDRGHAGSGKLAPRWAITFNDVW